MTQRPEWQENLFDRLEFVSSSLTRKLFFAFLLVSIISVGLVGLTVGGILARQFQSFIDAQSQTAISGQLLDYYRENGGWDEVGSAAIDNRMTLDVGEAFVLDADGNIVLPIGENLDARLWWQEQIQQEILLEVDGEIIGRIVAEPIGQEFLTTVRNTLIVASLGAIVIAFLLARLISRTLTRPVRELTEATQAVARGAPAPVVPVLTRDEVGTLAQSFNQMNAELTRSRELRRQLTADIAHELRTPLGLVLGHTEALRDGILPPSAETFSIIHDETVRLNRLVLDLRTLSMAEADELTLEVAEVDVKELLKSVALAHAATAAQAGVTVSTQFDSAELPLLSVDGGRIAQVLNNLVANALRYVSEGGEVLLSTENDPSNNQIILAVKDDGVGISAEKLPYIFERFYRADKSRSRALGGSGLGLAIAKSLVERHGGELSAESELGKGTTFFIKLPIESNKQ